MKTTDIFRRHVVILKALMRQSLQNVDTLDIDDEFCDCYELIRSARFISFVARIS